MTFSWVGSPKYHIALFPLSGAQSDLPRLYLLVIHLSEAGTSLPRLNSVSHQPPSQSTSLILTLCLLGQSTVSLP